MLRFMSTIRFLYILILVGLASQSAVAKGISASSLIDSNSHDSASYTSAKPDSTIRVDSIKIIDTNTIVTSTTDTLTIITARKTGVPEIDSLPMDDWKIQTPILSYPTTIGLSALFPGGGQYYSGHYVRGSFLLALEGTLISMAYNDQKRIDDKKRLENSYFRAAVGIADSGHSPDSLCADINRCIGEARQARDNYLRFIDGQKSQIVWALGLHFYGMMDALEIALKSRQVLPDSVSAMKAFWWGLVFPGGGQIVNGKLGKFGMLWMALGASTASIIYRQDMVDHFQKRIAFATLENDPQNELSDLHENVTLFRKRRNQYYWGMALLYLYSIADGVVDATLSDFDHPKRFAMGPGITPMSLELCYRF